MIRPVRKILLTLGVTAVLIACAVVLLLFRSGKVIDEYSGVEVRSNGPLYFRSHGRHVGPDGYYYGQKWQCVEFVKRFYSQAFSHRMPDGTGHAKDFFDGSVAHGGLNRRRGMLQFRNGGDQPPAPDDLLVFTDGKYGHVAIVTRVTDTSMEVIQQNIFGRTRQTFDLSKEGSAYSVNSSKPPAGWLRLP